MKRYFVVSDIHSFHSLLRDALKKSGFRVKNPDHVLIICGDIFDRGDETEAVLKFIKSIPKKRRVLIRGNHEYLFCESVQKLYPDSHDFSNGTVNSICQLAGIDPELMTSKYYYKTNQSTQYKSKIAKAWYQARTNKKVQKIANWFRSSDWVDYYELGKFIFVHSFIPLKIKDEYKDSPFQYYSEIPSNICEYDPNWRDVKNWSSAVWGCPWRRYQDGFFDKEKENGKILVCGHWCTYDFRIHLDHIKYQSFYQMRVEKAYALYHNSNLIALDSTIVLYNDCNVLVIDENMQAFDKFGNKLDKLI